MWAITVSNIDKFFRENVDKTNIVLQEKVTRYKDLRKIYFSLDQSIKSDGSMVTVENGSQKYPRINPAIAEKEKLNAQLTKLENEINLGIKRQRIITRESAPKTPSKEKKAGLV